MAAASMKLYNHFIVIIHSCLLWLYTLGDRSYGRKEKRLEEEGTDDVTAEGVFKEPRAMALRNIHLITHLRICVES